MDVILVRMACTREGCSACLGPAQVNLLSSVKRFPTDAMLLSSLLAAERQAYFRTFVLASVAGIFSLFPLIFTPAGGFASFRLGLLTDALTPI